MTIDANPQVPPTTPIPAATPPKKPNPFVRIGLGCLSVIILGCVGISAFALYQNSLQEQNYNAGHAAYTNGDCATAVEPLTKAASGEPGTKDSDVARNAQAELQECEALIAADDLAGSEPGDAVVSYSDFVTKYPASPLASPALTKGQELVTSSAPDALANTTLCSSIDALEEQQFISQPDTTLPPLLHACGQAFEDEGSFSDAVMIYDRFRDDYPDHELAQDVQLGFVRATLAEAEALGAGALPAPQAVGESSGGEGEAIVIIQNDSPEGLSMVFSGPDVRVEELEPCTDCEEFTGEGPDACPEKGAVGRYVVTPGDYNVVVKATSDSGVTPFSGNWTLEPGQEYYSCFYLVSN